MTEKERNEVVWALNQLTKEVEAGKIQEFEISYEQKTLTEAIKRPKTVEHEG